MEMLDKMRGWIFPLLLLAIVASPVSFAQEEAIESLRQTSKAFAAVARKASPAVVFIQVESTREGAVPTPFPPFGEEFPFGDDLFKRFFGDQFPGVPPSQVPQAPRRAIGQGSGFVFESKEAL